MYPFIRMFHQLWLHRKSAPLAPLDTHVSHHRCYPWDIDLWMELNNGRTLTIYDLGRIPLAKRTGMVEILRRNKWGLTMAGASVRYRSRVRTFEKIEMRSRALGWDDKFIYLDQSMWRGETCCNQALYRSAITSREGIVAPARFMDEMGLERESPPLPDWVEAWIAADAERPWPPERV